jgi:osmotically inducible protein OsmC
MGRKADRSASAVWQGNLLEGAGTFEVGSRALPRLPVTWKARTSSDDPMTTPEELIAAAHASCFSMALSADLAGGGYTAERLATDVTVTFGEQDGGGWKITGSHITVRGTVPGMSRADFIKAAEGASQGCPVSGALKGNVAITIDAGLA